MILGHITQPETYAHLPEAFRRSLAFLAETDMVALPTGRHDIDGDNIYVNVMAFDTQPANEKLAEVHKEYIDIQFLISGAERIGFALANDRNPIAKEYDAESDFYLVESMEGESEIIMSPDMFAIFLTEQPHKPGCNVTTSTSIKKAVVKVHKSLLA
ncbi:YhcH/YjgK/YiaL family protein [Enterovibrio sp. ZSDZ35]|uniref:YhcH/YjgK/YiaL family protein n=1 Tax=Enterovibrio qingdaonensis TaxID=2899818 RepID=A0ABT5QMI8_9GAMM|nr:N-acetylneuraminate anomerase [Enterovibrio sp. ZSDZ35]MDD1781501.1 YhcH/YjgK/YiaL family protein [Enterovibrio sp. ZSDZ35]